MNINTSTLYQELLSKLKNRGFDFNSSFEKHIKQPQISLRIYLESIRKNISKNIKNKIKIYLDTKYWIKFRDCALNNPENSKIMDAYNIIQLLVNQKKVICPISTVLFIELQLQGDPIKLHKMADLMDLFSDGVSIDFDYDRLAYEIVYMLTKFSNPQLHNEIKNTPWTNTGRIFGQGIFKSKSITPEQERAFQKSIADMFSYLTIKDFILNIKESYISEYVGGKEKVAESINIHPEGLKRNKSEFNKIFLDEIGGLVSLSEHFMKEALIFIYEKMYSKEPSVNEDIDWKTYSNVIYNLFAHNKITDELPFFRIYAGLNANIRCGFTRTKFEKNDFDDFRHAACSLPYYDYFFTENTLAHMITHNPTNYAKLYNTKVASKIDDVIKELETIT